MYVNRKNRLRTKGPVTLLGCYRRLSPAGRHQTVRVGKRGRSFEHRFVCASGQQFPYRSLQTRHRPESQPGADTQAGHAEPLELGDSRNAGKREQVERAFEGGHDSLYVGATADGWDEETIGAGLAV